LYLFNNSLIPAITNSCCSTVIFDPLGKLIRTQTIHPTHYSLPHADNMPHYQTMAANPLASTPHVLQSYLLLIAQYSQVGERPLLRGLSPMQLTSDETPYPEAAAEKRLPGQPQTPHNTD